MSSRKKLMENFLSLVFLQGFNYLLPLLTLPYLVRVLGPGNYGIYAFAQSFVQFFVILTDYGFNLTATKQISLYREDELKLRKVYNAVLNSKLILLGIGFLVYFPLVFFVPRFYENVEIFLLGYGTVVGTVLFPIWFFQGMEKMKFISILNILSKTLFTIGIFVFVGVSEDLVLVPTLNSLGFIIAGLISLAIVRFKFGVKYSFSTFKEIKEQMKEGFDVFLSSVAISLYTVSNTFILGLFTNNTIVGYYASAEKLINAATGIINPISQTIYPHVSRLVSENKETGLNFIRKVLKYLSGFTLVISVTLIVFAELIVDLLLGPQYTNSIIIIRILAFLPFVISLSNIFGVQTMLTFGYNKPFSRILIGASFLNILIAIVLVPLFQHVGTAIGIMFTETFVTVVMGVYLYRKKLLLRG